MSRSKYTRASAGARACQCLLVASLAAVASSASVRSNTPPDCTSPLTIGQNSYDFSTLADWSPISKTYSFGTPPSTTSYTVDLSLCSALPKTGTGEESCAPGTRTCLRVASSKDESRGPENFQIIPLITDADGSYDVEEKRGTNHGLEFEFQGPQYAGRRQKFELTLICDPKAGKDAVPDFQGHDLVNGKTSMSLKTPAACPKDKRSGETTAGESQSGWGFFSWLFFLLIVGTIAYFAIGMYRNQQMYGVAEVPHRDLLRELPYLIQ